jgi:NAD-dependent SIR2 family protein deacetylase
MQTVEDSVVTNFTETAVLLGAGPSAEAGVPTSFEMTDLRAEAALRADL